MGLFGGGYDIAANIGIDGLDKFKQDLNTADQETLKASHKLQASLNAVAIAGSLIFVGAIGAASEFESSFAGIVKTTSGLSDDFGNLNTAGKEMADKFRELALVLPLSVNELNKIGELGGQLGIPREELDKFADTIARLAVSSNLGYEQGSTELARFVNITKQIAPEGMAATEQIARIASTIVDLGNNFATTEAEISEFGQRLAGAGTQMGLSQSDILAIGAALSSLGINAEAGGTAFSKVMSSMFVAMKEGNPDLALFAETAGMTAEQFGELIKNNPAQALQLFIAGLGGVSESGGNVYGVLDNLNLADIRVRDSLLRASGASDLFKDAIDRASIAFKENTALTDESNKRFNTFKSQVQLLKNAFYDAFITLGNYFLPVLKSILQFVNENAAVVTTLITTIGSLIMLAGALAIFYKAWIGLNALLKLSFGPTALAISAIILAAVALYTAWKTNMFGIRDLTNSVWNTVKSAFNTVWTYLKQWGQVFSTYFSGIWDVIKGFFTFDLEKIKSGLDKIWLAFKGAYQLIIDAWAVVLTTIWNALKSSIFNIGEKVKDIWDGFKTVIGWIVDGWELGLTALWNALKSSVVLLVTAMRGIWDGIVYVISLIWTSWTTAWTNVYNYLTGVVGSIGTALSWIWDGLVYVAGLIKTTWETLWNAIKEFVSDPIGSIKTAISGIYDKAVEIWGNIKTAWGNMWEGLKEKLGTAVADITTKAGGIYDGIKGAFDNVVTYLVGEDGLIPKIAELFGGLGQIIIGIFTLDKETVKSGFSKVEEAATEVWNSTIGKILEITGIGTEAMTGKFKGVVDDSIDHFDPDGKWKPEFEAIEGLWATSNDEMTLASETAATDINTALIDAVPQEPIDKMKELKDAGVLTTGMIGQQILEWENLKTMAGDDKFALKQINEKLGELYTKMGEFDQNAVPVKYGFEELKGKIDPTELSTSQLTDRFKEFNDRMGESITLFPEVEGGFDKTSLKIDAVGHSWDEYALSLSGVVSEYQLFGEGSRNVSLAIESMVGIATQLASGVIDPLSIGMSLLGLIFGTMNTEKPRHIMTMEEITAVWHSWGIDIEKVNDQLDEFSEKFESPIIDRIKKQIEDAEEVIKSGTGDLAALFGAQWTAAWSQLELSILFNWDEVTKGYNLQMSSLEFLTQQYIDYVALFGESVDTTGLRILMNEQLDLAWQMLNTLDPTSVAYANLKAQIDAMILVLQGLNPEVGDNTLKITGNKAAVDEWQQSWKDSVTAFQTSLDENFGKYNQFMLDADEAAKMIDDLLYFNVDLSTTDADEAIAALITEWETYLTTLDPNSQAFLDAQESLARLKQKYNELTGQAEDLNDELDDQLYYVQELNIEYDKLTGFTFDQFDEFIRSVGRFNEDGFIANGTLIEMINRLLMFNTDLSQTNIDEQIADWILQMQAFLATLDPTSLAYQQLKTALDELVRQFEAAKRALDANIIGTQAWFAWLQEISKWTAPTLPDIEGGGGGGASHVGGFPMHTGGYPKAHLGYLERGDEVWVRALRDEMILNPTITDRYGKPALREFNRTGDSSVLGGWRNLISNPKINVVVHEANPRTWVEITQDSIYPEIKNRQRNFETEGNPYQ